jgi:hypothetical protein
LWFVDVVDVVGVDGTKGLGKTRRAECSLFMSSRRRPDTLLTPSQANGASATVVTLLLTNGVMICRIWCHPNGRLKIFYPKVCDQISLSLALVLLFFNL